MKRLILSLLLTLSLGITALSETTASATELNIAPNANVEASAHVVQAGENLFRISLRYGVSVQAIMTANGLDSHIVYIGQRLIIPNSSAAAETQPSVTAPQSQPEVAAAANSKSIYVSLSKQRVYLYQNGQLTRSYIASTGMRGATKVGNFQVQTKLLEAYASTWQLRMPYWLGIYYVGRIENGFHALPINRFGQTMWAGFLGRPASYGCVVLGTADAATLYRWADVGTSVSIRW